MLRASGALRKCSSISRPPASSSANASKPSASVIDSPTEDHSEKRPPIQSQNSNILAGSMPKARTASRLVDTATKWRASPLSGTPRAINHWRVLFAFAIVSSVVKVFEQTITSVRSGSSRASVSASSVPSTLDTKCTRGPEAALPLLSPRPSPARCASARHTMRGPRSEPPMPRLTTSVMVLPPWPFHSPLRTRCEKSRMRESTSCTAGITGLPSTWNGASGAARSAICSAARSSVALICVPANMASRRAGTLASSASWTSRSIVSGTMRFFE